MVSWMRAARVIGLLAVTATLTACGSTASASAGPPPGNFGARSSSGSPAQGAKQSRPAIVNLAGSFSPHAVRLRPGQQFQIVVSSHVKATGIPWPGACATGTVRPVAGGLLTVRCQGGGRYLYTARRSGHTIVSATVVPRCAPGTMCPTWMTQARLTVVIS